MLGNSTACKNARSCDGPPLSKTCLCKTYTKFNSMASKDGPIWGFMAEIHFRALVYTTFIGNLNTPPEPQSRTTVSQTSFQFLVNLKTDHLLAHLWQLFWIFFSAYMPISVIMSSWKFSCSSSPSFRILEALPELMSFPAQRS